LKRAQAENFIIQNSLYKKLAEGFSASGKIATSLTDISLPLRLRSSKFGQSEPLIRLGVLQI
jgi:hypothetical protein